MNLDLNLDLGETETVAPPIPAPVITVQPASQSYDGITPVTLSVTATGATGYQWYEGASGDTGTPLSGETGSSTVVSDPATTQYWVRVSNTGPSVADSNTATVTYAPAVPTANRTARYIASVDADFTLTGSSVDNWENHDGVTDLDIPYVSDTKMLRDTTVPINTTGKSVRTNNADCLYKMAAGGTVSDWFPSGVGTLYMVLQPITHPDRFNAPDHIITTGTAPGPLDISIVDGPFLHVGTNANTQQSEQTISLATWHLITISIDIGVKKFKVQIDDDDEDGIDGAAIITLTDRIQFNYDSGDAGRFNGAYADFFPFSVVHSQAQKDEVKAALRAIYADI